jgi:hypothetical protein
VTSPLVANLGIGPEVWLLLSLLSCLTLFFKFSRVWSVRNLDLLLLFAPAPGMLVLVGAGDRQDWAAFAWLFLGSLLWLARCVVDLGLVRRPLLEPNLNSAGLACLAMGVLGLLVAETVSLPLREGAARNPADPGPQAGGPVNNLPAGSGAITSAKPSDPVLPSAPQPGVLKWRSTQVIVSRVLAGLSHLALVSCLIVVGWRHFDRPISGLAVATCYLIAPYTRIAVVDSGQLVPAALTVGALALYTRPACAGALIGLAAGWMPACLGLIPLWIGFYRGRGALRFAAAGLIVVATCGLLAAAIPGLAVWGRAMGARSLAEAGLWPGVEAPLTGSFWSGIDPSYRLPVLIAYLAMALVSAFWPGEKNLGTLISQSAALLVAGQFWYLDKGGTLVLLYLPLVLLMMFRPNLTSKRAVLRAARSPQAQTTLFPVR